MPYRIEDLSHPVNCLFCGTAIPFGRPDRKFCSPACKNKYHNRRKYPPRELMQRRVLRILDSNRHILDRLCRLGIRSLDRETLHGLGFHPEYMTSYRKAGVHHRYSCFEFCYELTPSRIKKITCTLSEGAGDSTEAAEGIRPAALSEAP